MSWVRLDDSMPDHEKLNDVSAEGCWLHVCGIAFCSRNLTDGFIAAGKVPGLLSGKKSPAATKRLVAQLVDAGLWKPIEGGFEIHDYLTYNPSKEQVLAKREAGRLRVEKARAVKNGNAIGNALHKRTGESRNGVGNALQRGDVTPLVTLAPAPAPPGVESGFVRTDLDDVTHVAPPPTATNGDIEHLTPEAKAIDLLVRDGKTLEGARDMVGAVGAEKIIATVTA